MGSAGTNTLSQVVPHWPGLNDVNSAALVNRTKVTDPVGDPTAEALNTNSLMVIAYGQVVPHTILTVRFNAGTPVIDRVYSANDQVGIGSFTPTDNGPGDTTITWAVGLFPDPKVDATACVTEDVEIDRVRTIVASANSVRVKTKLGAAGTDARFTLQIF